MFLTTGHDRPFPSVPWEALWEDAVGEPREPPPGGPGRPGRGTPERGGRVGGHQGGWVGGHGLCTRASLAPPPRGCAERTCPDIGLCLSLRGPRRGPSISWTVGSQKLRPPLQLGLPPALGLLLWGSIFCVRSQWGSVRVSHPHFRDEETAWAAGPPLRPLQ